jgi:hypothetical protein
MDMCARFNLYVVIEGDNVEGEIGDAGCFPMFQSLRRKGWMQFYTLRFFGTTKTGTHSRVSPESC